MMRTQSNYGVLPLCRFLATTGVSYNLQHLYTNTSTPRYDLNVFKGGAFINNESEPCKRIAFPQKAARKATSAPIWLVQRMDASLKRQPRTLDEIRMQYKASMEVRRRSIDSRDS